MTITMSTIERAIAIAAAAHAGPVDKPITVADILPLAIGDRTLNARDQEILRVTIHRALHKIASAADRAGRVDRALAAHIGRAGIALGQWGRGKFRN